MERKKLSLSRRVSLGAMVAALTLLFLYASEVLTGFRFLCAALSGFFIVILAQEDLFGTAWLCFLTVPITTAPSEETADTAASMCRTTQAIIYPRNGRSLMRSALRAAAQC